MSEYELFQYGAMNADAVRLGAFRRAIDTIVQPGDVVVDIGAGTGTLSFLACRAGAARVYAIEPDPAIAIAEALAKDNGLSDRIVFLREPSEEVTLPERADVIVCDAFGSLPLYKRRAAALIDARERFLRQGGVFIPRQDEVWAAPVEARAFYGELTDGWQDGVAGVDASAAMEVILNSGHASRFESEWLLAPARCATSFVPAAANETNLSAALSWDLERDGAAHGVLLWYETEVAEGIKFRSRPGDPPLVYGQIILPLREPIAVRAGDTFSVDLRADLIGPQYVWQWRTAWHPHDDREPGRTLEQTTLRGQMLTAADLRRRDAQFAAGLSAAGEIDLHVLRMLGERRTSAAIADVLVAEYPDRFPSARAALDHIVALAAAYGA